MISPRFVIENLVYILLFIGSFWFTSDIMSSFKSGQSSFTETQIDITPADMPSLTFCFASKPDANINFWLNIG